MTVRDLTILGCSSQQPTRTRNHGAYLFRWRGMGLLVDPGEGTQRQFIFANIPPTCVHKIFVSHFHGDHCLGLGSMLMRLNLDKVTHPVHCYYPASGKAYFDRLRHGTIYHQMIEIIEHPIAEEGVIEEGETFRIEAKFLKHGVDTLGWRITEKDSRKFDRQKLEAFGIKGPMVRLLEKKGVLHVGDRAVKIDDVSCVRKGDSVAIVIDTLPCRAALDLAQGAKLFLCESTYLDAQRDLAKEYHHLTASQAAEMARQAEAELLILTHFSARYREVMEFEAEARRIFPNTFAAEDLKVFSF
ncbi:MAG: ribonuclease [Chlamydiota bacterium]|jgi:ribonuclease Z